MADEIKKLKSSAFTHKIGEIIFSRLPLPKIHPDIVSVLSLAGSVVFLFSRNIYFQIITIFIVILLDAFDGIIAKRYNYRPTEDDKLAGWMVDVTIDRLSEGLIALVFFIPLFPLFILNTALTLFSYTKKIHLILPLRQGLLIYLIIKAIA